MIDDHAGDDEERLAAAMRDLDALPPEVVRQALLDAGALDSALDTLADLAKNAEDPQAREEARRYIHDRGLGLISWAREDGPQA